MELQRWRRLKKLFDAARARAPEQREAFLDAACEDDPELRDQVLSLLISERDGFLERPAIRDAEGLQCTESRQFRPAASLPIGSQLAHYEILGLLGCGGMGDVYRARDRKLGREIALKVLPRELGSELKRRKRFEREARAASALNHPNIVTIYEIGRAGSREFIAMELVRGKSLREVLSDGSLELGHLLDVAIQIARGVASAHRSEILHRDLKPDNIMVTNDGLVKILDFGIAKLASRERLPPDELATCTELTTDPGIRMGTAAYMSPEQAQGKQVDHRSDIFSIGIVLYEMATGESPFKGDTTESTLWSVLNDAPRSAGEANPRLPRGLVEIIHRCMNKDPDRRYQSAADLRNELEELMQEVDPGDPSHASRARRSSPGRRHLRAAMGLLVVAAAAAAFVIYGITPLDRGRAPTAVSFTQVTSWAGEETFPTLSPDGDFVAYVSAMSGNKDIYLLRMGGKDAVNLTADSLADDTQPAFSPDGELLAFRSEREGGGIYLMNSSGESLRRLTHFGYNPAWAPDGEEIVFATEGVEDSVERTTTSQLWTVSVASGRSRLLTEGDAVQPDWSPLGHRIAFWALPAGGGQRDLWTMPADGGVAVPVTNDAHVDWNPVWSPDGGYLFFSSDRAGSMNLWRVAIDEESGEVLGEPQAITTGASATRQQISFSRDGHRIAYVERIVAENIQKAAFDPVTGTSERQLTSVTQGSEPATAPNVSPDGQWIAFSLGRAPEDIFIVRPDGTDRRQITSDSHRDRKPRWSPDGSRIAFESDRSDIYQIWTRQPDGSGLERVSPNSDVGLGPVWSPDGRSIVCSTADPYQTLILQLGKLPEAQASKPLHVLGDRGEYLNVTSWSSDGKWLAGAITGNDGVAAGIAIYSLGSGRYESLTDFGKDPEWLSDSRHLLFRDGGTIYFLDIETGEAHEVLSVGPDEFESLSLSPDDRWIYFSRITKEADIWMLTLNEER